MRKTCWMVHLLLYPKISIVAATLPIAKRFVKGRAKNVQFKKHEESFKIIDKKSGRAIGSIIQWGFLDNPSK